VASRRRGGLVGQQQAAAGTASARRDHGALTHAAAISAAGRPRGGARGWRCARARKSLAAARCRGLPGRHRAVAPDRLHRSARADRVAPGSSASSGSWKISRGHAAAVVGQPRAAPAPARPGPPPRCAPVIGARRGGCSRSIERSVTLLPEPDSPISADDLAALRARRSTPSTARTGRRAAGEGHRQALRCRRSGAAAAIAGIALRRRGGRPWPRCRARGRACGRPRGVAR
jgi:hypothetical protein